MNNKTVISFSGVVSEGETAPNQITESIIVSTSDTVYQPVYEDEYIPFEQALGNQISTLLQDISEPATLVDQPLQDPEKSEPTVVLQDIEPEISQTSLVMITHVQPAQNTIGSSFWDSVDSTTSQRKKSFDAVWLGMIALVFVLLFGSVIYNNRPSPGSVLSANATPVGGINAQEYGLWANKYFGKIVAQSDDEDSDQLTNKEEYQVGSDPTKYSTCNTSSSDAETLYELIDPKTCKPVQISDNEVITRLSSVIDLKKLNQQLATKSTSSTSSDSNAVIAQILSETGVLSRDQLETAQQKLDQQKQYSTTLALTDAYMVRYRSYGPLDRNYELPATAIDYLKISLKYNVPLKYMIAIARLESRFGTDRFTDSGAETRPGQYKNIFSLGLDDSNNNLNYATWTDGIEGFGRWYKNLQDKGVSDCAKWRIYNPNGDYCSKVETTAGDYENFKP